MVSYFLPLALWTPRFIFKLAGEDRCHFNGLAEPVRELYDVLALPGVKRARLSRL